MMRRTSVLRAPVLGEGKWFHTSCPLVALVRVWCPSHETTSCHEGASFGRQDSIPARKLDEATPHTNGRCGRTHNGTEEIREVDVGRPVDRWHLWAARVTDRRCYFFVGKATLILS